MLSTMGMDVRNLVFNLFWKSREREKSTDTILNWSSLGPVSVEACVLLSKFSAEFNTNSCHLSLF